jgi:hypothetical protein
VINATLVTFSCMGRQIIILLAKILILLSACF